MEEIKNNSQQQKKSRIVFTEELSQQIIKIYPTITNKEICEKFGIKLGTLQAFAQKHRLKKKGRIIDGHSGSILNREQKIYIRDNYKTMDTNEIANNLGISPKLVKGYACNNGFTKQKDLFRQAPGAVDYFVQKRNNPEYSASDYLGKDKEPLILAEELFKSSMGKYHVNRDYFTNIDNEWKAYWLGFLCADGCNDETNWTIRLKLKSTDVSHIEKFKESLQTDAPIKTYTPKNNHVCNGRTIQNNEVSTLNVCNKKICEDLTKNGCIKNKTYLLQFECFSYISEHLMRHFIRGYFDGDGWISVNIDKKMICLGFVGAPAFIEPLRDYLCTKLGIEKVAVKAQPDNFAVEVSWGSFVDCEKIYNFFYNDSNIFLERKFEKFDKILCLGQYEV